MSIGNSIDYVWYMRQLGWSKQFKPQMVPWLTTSIYHHITVPFKPAHVWKFPILISTPIYLSPLWSSSLHCISERLLICCGFPQSGVARKGCKNTADPPRIFDVQCNLLGARPCYPHVQTELVCHIWPADLHGDRQTERKRPPVHAESTFNSFLSSRLRDHIWTYELLNVLSL